MYNCSTCGVPTGPKIPMFISIAEERGVEYKSGAEVLGYGTETVSEKRECPDCAGGKAPIPAKVDLAPYRATAKSMQGHASGCKKPIEECRTCVKNVEWFASLPPHILCEVL